MENTSPTAKASDPVPLITPMAVVKPTTCRDVPFVCRLVLIVMLTTACCRPQRSDKASHGRHHLSMAETDKRAAQARHEPSISPSHLESVNMHPVLIHILTKNPAHIMPIHTVSLRSTSSEREHTHKIQAITL